MIFTEDDAIHCLGKAKEILEQYRLYSLHPEVDVRSIDDLKWICGDYLQRQVEVYDLPIEAQNRVVRGLFIALADGTYQVFRLADLGDREKRFVTCKELFHVILDEERCRNMDLWAHLEESQTSLAIEHSEPNSSVKMEIMAEMAAMEFLFPYEKRVEELGRGAVANEEFFEALAHKYGVPQIYVEAYLSDRNMAEFAKVAGRY